jgi:phosphoenolpyruvate carboxylase
VPEEKVLQIVEKITETKEKIRSASSKEEKIEAIKELRDEWRKFVKESIPYIKEKAKNKSS